MIASPATAEYKKVGYTLAILGEGAIPNNYGPYYQFTVDGERDAYRKFRSEAILRAYQVAKANGAEHITIVPIGGSNYDSIVDYSHAIECVDADILVPVGFDDDPRIYKYISNICETKTYMGDPVFAVQSYISDYDGAISVTDIVGDRPYSNIFNCIVYAPGYGRLGYLDQYDIDNPLNTNSNINGISAVAVASRMLSLKINEPLSGKEIYGVFPANYYTASEIDAINSNGLTTLIRDGFDNIICSQCVSYQNRDSSDSYSQYKTMHAIRILHYCAKTLSRALHKFVGKQYHPIPIREEISATMDSIVSDDFIYDYRYTLKPVCINYTQVDLEIALSVFIFHEVKSINIIFRRSL